MKSPNILLIENDPATIKELALALEPEGYDLAVAIDIIQAFHLLEEEEIDLILVDAGSVAQDIGDLCERVRSSEDTQQIPILILRGDQNAPSLEELLNLDADDHINKSFHLAELHRRIRTLLELKRTREALGQAKEELQLTQDHLNGVIEQLELASRTDLLTGLCNRKQALEKIEEESARAIRSKRNFALIVCDVDHFHKINDECGNDVGDFVLRALSSYFRNAVRRQDTVSRWGGEEFLFILPETDALGAKILAEKMRSKLENFALSYGHHRLSVTCSFGTLCYDVEQTPTVNMKFLDDALWESKHKGGNKVSTVKFKRIHS